jgi:hypothetical protein
MDARVNAARHRGYVGGGRGRPVGRDPAWTWEVEVSMDERLRARSRVLEPGSGSGYGAETERPLGPLVIGAP